MSTCHNNPKKSSAAKINKHILSGYSLFTHCLHIARNNLDYYRGEDCVKKFCKDLKEQATKIINYEKKEMIPLTYEEGKSYKKQNLAIYAKMDLVRIMILMTIMIMTIKNIIT